MQLMRLLEVITYTQPINLKKKMAKYIFHSKPSCAVAFSNQNQPSR
ncbi:hypothetical protein Hanom_Chr01g00075371 [Helianthus anomalus]